MRTIIDSTIKYSRLLVAAFCISISTGSYADSKPHPTAIQTNKFANALVTLSNHLIQRQAVIRQESLGGYGGVTNDLEFYRQTKTIDKTDGKLISTVSWETKHPDRLHSIDVYIYDEQGRLIRDYSASYLPGHRGAPYQTLINLHNYSGELHGTRQFDALDNILMEDCQGMLNGKYVRFIFDYSEIPDSLEDIQDMELRLAYIACFKKPPTTAAPYTDPLVEISSGRQ